MATHQGFLISTILSIAAASAAHAGGVCTGDVSNRNLSSGLNLPLVKACIQDESGGPALTVQLKSGSVQLAGPTHKDVAGSEIVYVNISDFNGSKTRTTIRMKAKDRIRSEGSMEEHYIGSVEFAVLRGDDPDFRVKHRFDDIHFYSANPNHEIHWGYRDHSAPEHWGELKPEWEACLTGKEQSPIALSDATAATGVAESLQFDYAPVTGSMVNNGHALQVNVGDGASFSIAGKRYKLLQFHAHTPSEHTLNGKEFPMEIHFVHQADDKSMAVVGVLVETPAGNPLNQVLAAALREFPTKVNDPKELSRKINPARWLPAGRDYFNYAGSLTTPPCTEGISWFVLREPIKIAAEQVQQIRQFIGGENARRLHGGDLLPLEGRTLRFSAH